MDFICLLPTEMIDEILKKLIIKELIHFLLTNKYYYRKCYDKIEEYVYFKAKLNPQCDLSDLYAYYNIPFELCNREYIIYDDILSQRSQFYGSLDFNSPVVVFVTIDSNYIYHVYEFEKADDENEAFVLLSERKFVKLKDLEFEYVKRCDKPNVNYYTMYLPYVLNQISNMI
ncbi:MAG TPA: hypothetical protein VLG50_05560 [Candidatus Saccharimonadales bacterium]|nr:hypothetical protein [Candidatus Saccharimonadales bacterium]